ncbi:phage tail assembly chaperone [Methylorubrum podarium]|uniref:Phage tail assembly chaperone n=1 Tax=Methylorubrum podarium TaxID=200476 RepID=A0ABV1QVP8_9HYPH
MAAETKIGSIVYRCEKLPASEGLKLYVRVLQLFGPAPGLLATIKKGGATDISPQNAFMVLAMMEGANPDQMHDFVAEMVGLCRVGSDECVIGVKPADMESAVEVAWFALRTQFSDFLAVSLKAE